MSDNNNLLIGVAAIGVYLYLKNQRAQQAMPAYPQGGVPSMPGNVGTGSNQIGTGALVGFLQAIAGGFGNNSSTGYTQPNVPPSNFGAIQDSASSAWGALTDWANSGTVGDYGGGYDVVRGNADYTGYESQGYDTVRNELF